MPRRGLTLKIFSGHTAEQRSFEVTLTIVELVEAINVAGYTVLRFYEALLYTNSERVFSDYIRVLLRGKIIHSPLPANDDCDTFLEALNHRMGYDTPETCEMAVRKNDINPNPFLRLFSKTSCNSLSGKFGQKNEVQCSVVQKYHDI